MKTTAAIFFLIISNILIGNNTYLRIITTNDDVSYPPNTRFELFDSTNTLIASDKTFEGQFEINGNYKLVIYPNWKENQDIYHLNSGILRMETNTEYMQAISKQDHSSQVIFTKTIYKSEKNNEFNLTLSGSNGLEFKYIDGISTATYHQEDLKIIGKYVIECQEGKLKVSFNSKTKETWWVFQKDGK